MLSVGDLDFQAKCLDKIREVVTEGRTVLFVSHSISAVTRLCRRALLLDKGRLIEDGPTADVVSRYLNEGLATVAEANWPDPAAAPAGASCRLRAVRVGDEDRVVATTLDIRKPIRVEMVYDVTEPGYDLLPFFKLFDPQRVEVFCVHDLDPEWVKRRRPEGTYTTVVWIPGNLLSEGLHQIAVGCATESGTELEYYVEQAVAFQIIDALGEDTARGAYQGEIPGVIRPRLKWQTAFEPALEPQP